MAEKMGDPTIANDIDVSILKFCQQMAKGAASTPPLSLRKKGSLHTGEKRQPSLHVKGTVKSLDSKTIGQQKATGHAKQSIVRLYPGEVKDAGV